MRKTIKTPARVHVGMLHDDMAALAAKVYQSLIDGPRLIWAEDDGRVYAGDPEINHGLPTSWIAGTFAFGQPVSDIENDLRALLFERTKDWIIETEQPGFAPQ
jgi:hypothetical protein